MGKGGGPRDKIDKKEGMIGGKGKTEGEWRIAFWNVTGLGNKDKEFWLGLRDWDVVILMET